MKTLARLTCLLCALLFIAPAATKAETEIEVIADPAVYGAYPKDYKEIVTKWLATQLIDAASAKIEWAEDPKPAEMPGPNGQTLRGYRVDFKVNARNRFGTYTGKQKHAVLINNGLVLTGGRVRI